MAKTAKQSNETQATKIQQVIGITASKELKCLTALTHKGNRKLLRMVLKSKVDNEINKRNRKRDSKEEQGV